MPEKLSDIYALISYLISRNENKEVRSAGAKLLNRLSPEMAVLLLRDLQRANPKFAMDPSYQKFVKDHGDLLELWKKFPQILQEYNYSIANLTLHHRSNH